jgi:hypothetical protein
MILARCGVSGQVTSMFYRFDNLLLILERHDSPSLRTSDNSNFCRSILGRLPVPYHRVVGPSVPFAKVSWGDHALECRLLEAALGKHATKF